MKKITILFVLWSVLIVDNAIAQMPLYPTATGEYTLGFGYRNYQVSTKDVNNGILGYDAQLISLRFGYFHTKRWIYTSTLGFVMPSAGEGKINPFFHASAGVQYQYPIPKHRVTLFAFLTANGGYVSETEYHPLFRSLRLRIGFGGAYHLRHVRPFIAIFEQAREYHASSGSTLILNKLESLFLTEIGISADINKTFSVVTSLQIPINQRREVVTQMSATVRY